MEQSRDSRSRVRHARRRVGRRTHRACVSCKEKKLKCDDQTPACANCSRLSLTCLFEDPETKQHRPRNYLETLEARVAFLEDGNQISLVGGSSSSLPTPERQQGSSRHGTLISDEGDGTTDLSLQARILDVRSTQTEPQYLGSSSTFAFSHIINSSLCRHLPERSKPLLGLLTRRAPSPYMSFLPDEELAFTLSNAYFANIQPQYPFLHEPTFRLWEKTLATQSHEVPNSSLNSLPLFFVNMVYAVGALLFPNYQSLAEQLYTSAQLYSDVLSLDNLETIQALLCYAMYSLRSPIGPSLWKVTGLALRQCIELGYHRKNKLLGPLGNDIHLQIRRRTFWCAYGIECMVSLWLGRPLSLPLHEVSAEFPMDFNDSLITDTLQGTPRSPNNPPTSMSTAIHVFRLRCLWARIHHSLYSENALANANDVTYRSRIEELRAELDEWLASAPQVIPRTGRTLSIFATRAWYELNYNYTVLLLYRTELAEGRDSANTIFSDCIKAAKDICTQYRRLYVGTPIRHTWGTLRCIFFAGLVYLHCLWTAPGIRDTIQYDDVSRTCTDATMVLVVIAQAWEEAAPYRDLFETLANRTMTMIVNRNNGVHTSSYPRASADPTDQETLTQWMADIANTGMSDEMEELLAGFIDEFMTYDVSS
ncbi:fungal-specific transcription factor domain-containing protein [Talaromyces proteolyticus]|uniref:Fungal-specific transcription factor domain-containing protein n=1 Tax=Talaromyces proteolyticus TaxID=1131652 RepID=A0AAD4PZB1_9EURO|nr:fungal-specific transcription factor domain-containing protein [Talaromyces proteolyticus]KAH8696217.1 fungal-specific transcription factor domain-containing protein [Talaromyces proteolyticus]